MADAGCVCRICSTTARTGGVEPSSMTISSQSWYVWASTLSMASVRRVARLCVGRMMLTVSMASTFKQTDGDRPVGLQYAAETADPGLAVSRSTHANQRIEQGRSPKGTCGWPKLPLLDIASGQVV